MHLTSNDERSASLDEHGTCIHARKQRLRDRRAVCGWERQRLVEGFVPTAS